LCYLCVNFIYTITSTFSYLPVALEAAIDTWEDGVDNYLARAVYEHMDLNADKVSC
jgi:hypothetical protein